MLHQIRTPRRCLGDRERTILLRVAEAALPAGRHFPAAGPHTVERVETFLAGLPAYLQRAYRALLTTLDNTALLRHRRRFASLSVERRLDVLEAWHLGGIGRRQGIRVLMAPLKVAHFDDPAFYKELGCVYEFEQPTAERKPRYMTERVHTPAELAELPDDELELECDVVVVGSGAGGAVVAKELAELGHAVVILEEGAYFDRTDFTGRPFEMQARMYRNAGATFSIGNVGIPIPVGRTVGGSTTVNSGTCYRVPGRVLAKWRDQLGLRDMTEAHLDPYYQRVENILGVEEAAAEHLGGAARVIARGCDVLGYDHKPLRRNAPDCDGKGVCCFGCPTDAKRSTNVSYVPMALRAGAELFAGVRVSGILTEGDRAVGVTARTADDDARSLTVRARRVVISCGTLSTPVLLQKNRLCGGSSQLGRNLSIHPAAAGLAVYDEDISGFNAIPQGYAIEEFHDEGILFEGASTPVEITMAAMPFVGPQLVELAERFDRVAMFGYMVEDSSRGRVRTVRGRPVITYRLNDRDVAKLKRGAEILARVFFAAGAREVHLPVHGFTGLRSPADLARLYRTKVHARDFELSAYHPLGTACMGSDPTASVVDESNQAHDVKGLYVVDGSSVPSSLAVNPQVTIMALATRAAERIDASLAR